MSPEQAYHIQRALLLYREAAADKLGPEQFKRINEEIKEISRVVSELAK